MAATQPSTAAEQSTVPAEPDNDADDEEEDGENSNDDNAESGPVPQVMVGPDGNIILNPGRWLAWLPSVCLLIVSLLLW